MIYMLYRATKYRVPAKVTELNISWNFMSRDGIRKLTRHIKENGQCIMKQDTSRLLVMDPGCGMC